MYIREAHPVDGWAMPVNRREGIEIPNHKDLASRRSAASKCVEGLKLALPTLIDSMDGSAEQSYSGWPDRIFLVGLDGKLAYRGEPGPRGFSVGDAEAALRKLLGLPGRTAGPDERAGEEGRAKGGEKGGGGSGGK